MAPTLRIITPLLPSANRYFQLLSRFPQTDICTKATNVGSQLPTCHLRGLFVDTL